MTNNQTKVLIIEDEEVLLDILEKKLEKENYKVYSSRNGEDGLKKFEEVKPDIVLLDIIMPKLNGYEVLERIKEKYGRQVPPIIIISNSGQPVEIERAMRLGASDFIIKTQLTPEDVAKKVEKQLAERVITEPGSAGPRVLIIEDDQFLRDLLHMKLEREGFQITTAIDGPEGLEKIMKGKPDLVLLDIILPSMDGFEILKKIRSDEKMDIATMPVILLTNLGQESDVEKGRALKADDYLIKSNFTIDEIIEKIKKLILIKGRA